MRMLGWSRARVVHTLPYGVRQHARRVNGYFSGDSEGS